MSCLSFPQVMLTPLKLASQRCRAFVPQRNSKPFPSWQALTSSIWHFVLLFLSLCQGKQIPCGYSWEMSLPMCTGTASENFEESEQIDAFSYLGCGLARWADSPWKSRVANSLGVRHRHTDFPPGWMRALSCVHRCLGWTDFQPGFINS